VLKPFTVVADKGSLFYQMKNTNRAILFIPVLVSNILAAYKQTNPAFV